MSHCLNLAFILRVHKSYANENLYFHGIIMKRKANCLENNGYFPQANIFMSINVN